MSHIKLRMIINNINLFFNSMQEDQFQSLALSKTDNSVTVKLFFQQVSGVIKDRDIRMT